MESSFSIICLVLLTILLILIVVWLFLPKKETGTKTVSVHLDGKAGVRITQSPDGLNLDIVYETLDEKPAEYSLMPDLVNDAAGDENAANRDFWTDVADLDNLPFERREKVLKKLVALGFLDEKAAQTEFFLNPDSDDNNIEEADPADEKAFARMNPEEDNPADNDGRVEFENEADLIGDIIV